MQLERNRFYSGLKNCLKQQQVSGTDWLHNRAWPWEPDISAPSEATGISNCCWCTICNTTWIPTWRNPVKCLSQWTKFIIKSVLLIKHFHTLKLHLCICQMKMYAETISFSSNICKPSSPFSVFLYTLPPSVVQWNSVKTETCVTSRACRWVSDKQKRRAVF